MMRGAAAQVASATAFSEKKPTKRKMDVIKPLRLLADHLILKVNGALASKLMVHITYTLPVAKVIVSPILTLRDVWIFHTAGNGRISIVISVRILTILLQRKKFVILKQ